MKTIAKRILAGALALGLAGSLAACENSRYGTKETIGTIGGAAAGAWAGSQIGSGSGRVVATAVGTLAGAVVGREIGRALDENDRRESERTTQYALERGQSGHEQRWNNPDSGNYGTVTPQPSYRNSEGQPCREYQQTIYVEGRAETAYGTACRNPDGSWRIVSQG